MHVQEQKKKRTEVVQRWSEPKLQYQNGSVQLRVSLHPYSSQAKRFIREKKKKNYLVLLKQISIKISCLPILLLSK